MTKFEVGDVCVQAAIIRAATQIAVATHGTSSTPEKVAVIARELAERLTSEPNAGHR